jgi:hypothetical protein
MRQVLDDLGFLGQSADPKTHDPAQPERCFQCVAERHLVEKSID